MRRRPLTRSKKIEALKRVLLDPDTKVSDIIPALRMLEKLEFKKSTKPRGRPFKKKVPDTPTATPVQAPATPVVNAGTPAQWEAEEDARHIPSSFEQYAEQLRLKAESHTEPNSGEKDGMGSPETDESQPVDTSAPSAVEVVAAPVNNRVDQHVSQPVRRRPNIFRDKPRPW